MNKNDLKNGMKFISRDGGIKYIIEAFSRKQRYYFMKMFILKM